MEKWEAGKVSAIPEFSFYLQLIAIERQESQGSVEQGMVTGDG